MAGPATGWEIYAAGVPIGCPGRGGAMRSEHRRKEEAETSITGGSVEVLILRWSAVSGGILYSWQWYQHPGSGLRVQNTPWWTLDRTAHRGL